MATGAQNDQQLAIRLEKERQLSNLLVDAGIGFVKRNPVKMSLWVLGMLLLTFATGFIVAPEIVAEYDAKMDTAADTTKLTQSVIKSHNEYQQNSGIFGCGGNTRCTAAHAKYQAASAKLKSVEAENAAIVSEAKAKLGVFSEYGVEETRGLFWRCFNGGKDFAKRSSWYDMMFMGISAMGRDESMVEFMVRWGIQVIFNFTMGMVGALMGFFWYVWSLINSFQCDFITGFSFFLLAVISATSLVTSYLFAMYAAAAGSLYVAGPTIIRAQLDGANRRQQRMLQQQRYHQQQQAQQRHYD